MSKDDLRTLKGIPEHQYGDLPLADLAAFAISVIEGFKERITIENICVTLHRLFPEKFSLVGFPEHPDGMRVNRTLLQMQPKYRNYATGSPKRGYSLTNAGRAAAVSIEKYLASRSSSTSHVRLYKRTRHQDEAGRTSSDAEMIRQVRESELFRLYASEKMKDARGLEFFALLDAFAHTPKKELKNRLQERTVAAGNVHDNEVINFLKACKARFAALIGD